jgi:hypothetical protein
MLPVDLPHKQAGTIVGPSLVAVVTNTTCILLDSNQHQVEGNKLVEGCVSAENVKDGTIPLKV